jgi:hypothetical protein
MLTVFRAGLLILCVVLTVGCEKKSTSTGGGKPPDPVGGSKGGPPGGFLTMENVSRIQIGVSTLADAKQTFGGSGEPTNEEKPGLMAGNKYVWKHENKKVYVSFGQDGKANGISWEGFGGK